MEEGEETAAQANRKMQYVCDMQIIGNEEARAALVMDPPRRVEELEIGGREPHGWERASEQVSAYRFRVQDGGQFWDDDNTHLAAKVDLEPGWHEWAWNENAEGEKRMWIRPCEAPAPGARVEIPGTGLVAAPVRECGLDGGFGIGIVRAKSEQGFATVVCRNPDGRVKRLADEYGPVLNVVCDTRGLVASDSTPKEERERVRGVLERRLAMWLRGEARHFEKEPGEGGAKWALGRARALEQHGGSADEETVKVLRQCAQAPEVQEGTVPVNIWLRNEADRLEESVGMERFGTREDTERERRQAVAGIVRRTTGEWEARSGEGEAPSPERMRQEILPLRFSEDADERAAGELLGRLLEGVEHGTGNLAQRAQKACKELERDEQKTRNEEQQRRDRRVGEQAMITTSTDGIEGREITSYLGIVSGEAVMGTAANGTAVRVRREGQGG